jgi:hypothetical protein
LVNVIQTTGVNKMSWDDDFEEEEEDYGDEDLDEDW